MDIKLKEFLHNLKDRNWDVLPTYSIDENEARKIVEALEETEKKQIKDFNTIELLQKTLREKDVRWTKLTDREPDKEGIYLVVFDDGYITAVNYDGNDWELWVDSGEPVAWQPLPEWRGKNDA